MKNLLAEHVSVTNMKKKEIKKGANTFYVKSGAQKRWIYQNKTGSD